jgi:hypothetical protein
MMMLGSGSSDQELRLEFCRELGPKIGCCAHRLLLTLCRRLRIVKREPENRLPEAWSQYFKAIFDLLAFTELEKEVRNLMLAKFVSLGAFALTVLLLRLGNSMLA